MYISSILIDVGENPDRPRPGRLWLRNIYRVHQRLCMGFPSAECKVLDPLFLKPYTPDHFPEDHYLADRNKMELSEDILKQVHSPRNSQSGFLFRIDPLPACRAMIIIQSAIEPDWAYAFRNADHLLAAPPQIKQYNPHFQNGQLLAFRLMANATCKKDKESRPHGKNNYGRRVPVPRENINEWLISRGERSGFRIKDAERLLSAQTGYVYASKENKEFKRFFYARYDGVLEVTDDKLLYDAIIRGIGPGKAFGFGLLSLSAVEV